MYSVITCPGREGFQPYQPHARSHGRDSCINNDSDNDSDSDSDSEGENKGDKVDDSKPRRILELNGANTRGSRGIVYAAKEDLITEVRFFLRLALFQRTSIGLKGVLLVCSPR